MSTNCLVTKLKDSVNNDNLKKVDEIVITTKAINAADYRDYDALKRIFVKFWSSDVISYVRTTGSGKVNTSVALLESDPLDYIEIPSSTDVTLYFSNGDYNIFIGNKYNLRTLQINGYGQAVKQPLFYFNLNEVAYAKRLSEITMQFQYSQTKGDISVLSELPLTTMMFTNTEGITGDITDFVIMDNGGYGGTKIYGDFTNIIKNCNNMGQLFNNSLQARTRDGAVSVDFSQANNTRSQFTKGIYQDVTCTWTTTRSSEYNIIAMKSGSNGKFDFGTYLDAMLNNQAQCPLKSGATGDNALIDVWGTRTSASDAAVETLKGKSVTVKINGVTL